MQNVSDKAGYMYVTPRTLLGIIRLSQALARLKLSEEVVQSDIEEAIRLMDLSRESIDEESTSKIGTKKVDKDSEIFNQIKEALKNKIGEEQKYEIVKQIVLKSTGFSFEDFEAVVKKYVGLNILYVSSDKNTIALI